MTAFVGVVHLAGPMIDWMQRCHRCGAVLADFRNACWLEADGPPGAWPEGHVTVNGNMTTAGAVDGAPLCSAKGASS
jgi:hypothetical protein